jgi:hypothetical protein
MRALISGCARPLLLLLGVAVGGHASAALTVTPITWDIIGLDSNSPATGPQDFPVGARVCSIGAPAVNAVTATFVFDDLANVYSGHSHINLRSTPSNSPSFGVFVMTLRLPPFELRP